jgi:hypothetical protein
MHRIRPGTIPRVRLRTLMLAEAVAGIDFAEIGREAGPMDRALALFLLALLANLWTRHR